jgi:replication factor C subunit 3/5
MSLFIDLLKPQSFLDLLFNHKVGQQLSACAQSKNLPHLMIRGARGSGRKTMARLYVQAHGSGVGGVPLKISTTQIDIKSVGPVTLYHSRLHDMLNLTHLADRVILKTLMDTRWNAPPASNLGYHLVVIENAGKLSQEAQDALRRTLEQHIATCRFIFLLENTESLISPIMSRCVQIRLSTPTAVEIRSCLHMITQQLPNHLIPDEDVIDEVIANSRRNLTDAINQLNRVVITSNTVQLRQLDELIDDLHQIVINTNNNSNTNAHMSLGPIRELLYQAMIAGFLPLQILKAIFYRALSEPKFNRNYDKIVQNTVSAESGLKQANKAIYHLEAYVVSLMLISINS